MIACPGCGLEAPNDFAFCPKCGAKLTSPPSMHEERKVVTTLFCDLVAFTSMSEAADPEDVDALLGEYFARATKVIESHGGTVEKFIGDAVVGVFGVPVVHEDDPERAVRAGLRIVEALEGMTRPDGSPLEVRVGINTGEALVRLDVDPVSGRGFLTGDAVNTAARLEAAAQPGEIAVGELTHELSQRAFVFEELPPVVAKGKAEPVAAWLAVAPVARRGLDTDAGDLTPFVGRGVELAYLSATFEKVSAQASPQLVLLVGEPGIGKSRLVRELLAYVDSRPGMTTWRQGYCPPFGEDVTYWALSEIVKGHAGIRDTDESSVAEAKLEAVVPPGPDREWLRQRLRALVGLAAPDASREENFTAWMRFFEEVAAARPTMLVFEDLHWADEALLAFLEHLATHLASVPLMVIGTARPELFERRPGFASGGPVNRVGLEPLSREETERLVAGLIGEPDDGSATVSRVVERCDGNPFYAEQSARLLADSALAVTLPDSVQAVIAARLDTLPADQKALLADAAVVGSVFWDGAVATMGGRDPREMEGMLSGLLERQMIRRIRETSMEGDREYAFVHALAREVAYAQLPRAARARKHAAVADWIEAKTSDRADDLAETLARHCTTALDMARASGLADLAQSLIERAIHYLRIAGARAMNLDMAVAERYLGRALELARDESPERQLLLLDWAHALDLKTRHREAADVLEGVLAAARETRDVRLAAKAAARLVWGGGILHDRSISDLTVQAKQLLEKDEPSPEKAEVLETWGLYLYACGDDLPEAIRAAEEAIAMYARLGLPEPAGALGVAASARSDLGDAGCLADYQRAIAVAESQGLGAGLADLYESYGLSLRGFRGPRAAVDVHNTGLELARSRRLQWCVMGLSVELVADRALSGEWDVALSAAAELAPQLEEAQDVFYLLQLRPRETLLLVRRGEANQVAHFLEWMTERGRSSEFGFIRDCTLLAASAAYLALGSADIALRLLAEWAAMPQSHAQEARELMPEAVRLALAAGDTPLATELAGHIDSTQPVGENALATAQALVTEARGQHEAAAAGFADAAARWHDFGVPYEEAQALLGQGRCLVALERPTEAVTPLTDAREILIRLKAKPALVEVDRLLDDVSTAFR